MALLKNVIIETKKDLHGEDFFFLKIDHITETRKVLRIIIFFQK